jgi:hypothetical protein
MAPSCGYSRWPCGSGDRATDPGRASPALGSLKRFEYNDSRHGAWMKRLCPTADRPSFGVRSLETAFPLPLFLFQSGVEPPHSKAFGSGGCHGAAPPYLNRPRLRASRPCLQVMIGRRGGWPSRARSQRLEGPAPPGPSRSRPRPTRRAALQTFSQRLEGPAPSGPSSSRPRPTPVCRVGTGRRRSALTRYENTSHIGAGKRSRVAVIGRG